MPLQYGKTYKRVDGKDTGPLVRNNLPGGKLSQSYPFKDPSSGMTYTENGEYLESEKELPISKFNLVIPEDNG